MFFCFYIIFVCIYFLFYIVLSFTARSDRYHHDVESDDEETSMVDESVLFSSFSSCSPRFSLLTEHAVN